MRRIVRFYQSCCSGRPHREGAEERPGCLPRGAGGDVLSGCRNADGESEDRRDDVLHSFGACAAAHKDDAPGGDAEVSEGFEPVGQGAGHAFDCCAGEVGRGEVGQGYPVQ